MYRSRVVVKVPKGLAVGQLIGKQGSNIKHLQTASCARMAVDTISESVTISGNAADVSRAVKLLEAQFASWRSSGDPGPAWPRLHIGMSCALVSASPPTLL